MSAISYELIEQNIALVTLNRPESYNAINEEVTQRMEEIVEQTENDQQVRVVILTGAGEKAFCAGADLKVLSAGKGDSIHSKKNGFGGFVYAKRTKPWIAAVNGFALAGGTEFCLACEMIVAAEGAKFGLPEVKRGLIAGAGGLFRLPAAIPQKIANEMILTGKHFDAALAYQYGMINSVVKKEDLLHSARSLAREIMLNSPNSIKESMHFMSEMNGKDTGQLIKESNQLFVDILESEDAKEGTLAFVEKREPRWN